MISAIEPKVHPNGLYSQKEAAKLLGLHRNTILRWENEGKIRPSINKTSMRKHYTGREIVRCWRAMA